MLIPNFIIMKRFSLFFLIIVCLSFSLRGQSSGDMANVLQKCLDLPELEIYYSQNTDGSFDQLNIMQHGVSFPVDIQVLKFGKPILLKSKQEIINGKTTYFLFYEFTLTPVTARVAYSYYYNPADPEAVIIVSLQMEKSADGWSVKQSKIERR